MPELPEVETVVRGLREPLIGRRIQSMWHDWAPTVHSPGAAEFAAHIAGQTIHSVNRRGKYILITLEHDTLVVHLKMSGRLYVTEAESTNEADRWVHVRFDLDDGRQLRFSDLRKFGRVYLTNDLARLLGHLGPEPLSDDFTLSGFRAGLCGRKRAIKAQLLDQEIVAGVGNIYADEALFRAGIHPAAAAGALTRTTKLPDFDGRFALPCGPASSTRAPASTGIASRTAKRASRKIIFTSMGGRDCPAESAGQPSIRFAWRSAGRISAPNVSRSRNEWQVEAPAKPLERSWIVAFLPTPGPSSTHWGWVTQTA